MTVSPGRPVSPAGEEPGDAAAEPWGPPPAGLDVSAPHPARVWNYWLGGRDFFAADKAAGEEIGQEFPHLAEMARSERAFLVRAVRFLAGPAKIRQYLDIGAGLPAGGNTHEIAQRIAPDSKIVYADNDPAVLLHAKALLGKAAVPDDSPYTTGGIGLLGTRPSQEAMEGCDTLLMVGTSFPYIEFLPKPGQARAAQIELDPMRIGLRYPVEVGLVGDSRATLAALLPLLRPQTDRGFLESAQERMGDWRRLMDERGSRRDKPMKPQFLARELGLRLSRDAIVACDSGTVTTWWARDIPARRGQMHAVSGNLATMACGLPYAIAAQIAALTAQRDTRVLLVGDHPPPNGGVATHVEELFHALRTRGAK